MDRDDSEWGYEWMGGMNDFTLDWEEDLWDEEANRGILYLKGE